MIKLHGPTTAMGGPSDLLRQPAGGIKIKGNFVITTNMVSLIVTPNMVYKYSVHLTLAYVFFCFQILLRQLSTIGFIGT